MPIVELAAVDRRTSTGPISGHTSRHSGLYLRHHVGRDLDRLPLYLEPDLQGDLELLYFSVDDPTTLSDDFKPIHVVYSFCRFGDSGLRRLRKARLSAPVRKSP